MNGQQMDEWDHQLAEQNIYRNTGSQKGNDSMGNNSGGHRSQKDQDFDFLGENYQKKLENKMAQQNEDLLIDPDNQNAIGPHNNPSQHFQQKNPEISLYDIESLLSSKQISILNFKKTLQTILQYLNALSMQEVKKFIKIVLNLPAFDRTFENTKQKAQQSKKMRTQNEEKDEIDSNLSAKSDKQYYLPPNGVQALFQIVMFLNQLCIKCSHIENQHLIYLIKQVMDIDSRFFNLPLRPEQLIHQNSEFVQNSGDTQAYKNIELWIQESYVSMFDFVNEVNSLKQIFYYMFAKQCAKNFFPIDSERDKPSIKMRIHNIKLMNELGSSSRQLFELFVPLKDEEKYLQLSKSQILKLQKQELQDYTNVLFEFSHKTPSKIQQYAGTIIETLIHDETSIQKKSSALKLIDKFIANTKLYPQTVDTLSLLLQRLKIIDYFLKDQTHRQLLRKLPPIVKFLYQLQKIELELIKKLIKQSIKAHQQFFKVIQSIVQYLKIKHLQQIFEFIKRFMHHEADLLNPHTVDLIQSVVNNNYLSANKKKRKMQQISSKKQQKQLLLQNQVSHVQLNQLGTQTMHTNDDHPLIYDIFGFLYGLVQQLAFQISYMPVICKHISQQIFLLLPILEQQFTNRLSHPKNYQSFIIGILEHCLKIDMDFAMGDDKIKQKDLLLQKQEGFKFQFINNLVMNCNLYDSIMVLLCKQRFQKNISERCLNILILVTKSYKPLQKVYIQILWKIIGLHSSNGFQIQQFFQFIKQILKNKINLSQESVKYIYFEIILKLHYKWFTPKIYDCFEMLFMRLNEDGKIITYDDQQNNNPNSMYNLNKTQFVGIQKFYYIYLWSDSKVSKKVKDLLFKLFSYKCSPQVKQKFSEEIIHSLMRYLKRNPQSADHVLYAQTQEDFQQHVNRAFELLSKFMEPNRMQNDEENTNNDNILVNIQNSTRQALPPIKKTIQVNRNMILEDFKELISKQLNPQIKQIELINKGKPLKVQKMSLRQLKIDNKSTVFVENLDFPRIKKQTQQKMLKQCKQTLISIFSEQYDSQVLGYVAQKYMGQQLQKICQSIMDEELMKSLREQLLKQNQQKQERQKQYLMIEKIHSTQNEKIQMLSFGQILAKQLQNLLKVIDSNSFSQKKTIIQKQWAIIHKIPPSQSVLFNIERQLNKQHVDFQFIFKLNPQKSINIESYIWYLLRKMINGSSLEFRRKLFFQQIYQKFIVSRLEELILNQIYHEQLYKQLIQSHQTILKVSYDMQNDQKNYSGQEKIKSQNQNAQFPIFCSLSSQLSKGNDACINPCEILTQVMAVLGTCKNIFDNLIMVSFSDSSLVYIKLVYILQNYQIDHSICAKLLCFLLQCIMSSKILKMNTQQRMRNLLSREVKPQIIYNLTRVYKEPILKFYLALLVIEIQESENFNSLNKSDINQHTSSQTINIFQQLQIKNYIKLRKYIEKLYSEVQVDQTLNSNQWLYFMLIGLVELQASDQSEFLSNNKEILSLFQKDLLYWIKIIMKKSHNMKTNELTGVICLIRKLSQKVFFNRKNSSKNDFFTKQYFQQISQFIEFMTEQFIFNLESVPIITQRLIKYQYYQILSIFCEFSTDLLFQIADKLIKFDAAPRNHENDTIDFRREGFVGIQNLGCTCYINSLIQQLYHTKLPYKLLSLKQDSLFELNHTFMQLFMSTKNVINIRPMIQQVKIGGNQIIPSVQQDVEQFLISLLSFIEQCNGKTIIDSIFGGSYSEELTYFSQKQEGKSMKKHKQQHFYNITLDIKGKKSLNEALNYFFRSQTLDDKIYCEQYDQKTSVVKRSFIKNFPKILIFTLKRFEYDMQNDQRIKLNDYLEFPMNLNLTQFSLDYFQLNQHSNQQRHSNNNIDSYFSTHEYTLCGILIHSGSAEAGHYYSYIKRQDRWYEFNDRIVTEINLQQKIKNQCFGGGQNRSRNAYMVFYQRKQSRYNKKIPIESKSQIMEVQSENKGTIEQDLQKTLPIQQNSQDECQHHGIFLSQIPQNNYLKQIVRDQNRDFIKQRLLYDPQYRRFVSDTLNRLLILKQNISAESQYNSNLLKAVYHRLPKLQKINQLLNPQPSQPIVHYVNNQNMDIQMKQITYEEEQERIRNRSADSNDIMGNLLDENNNDLNDFI